MSSTFRSLSFGVLLLALPVLSGCTEYWWTRGQPPDVKTLLVRSHAKLQESIESHGSARKELLPLAETIRTSLDSSLEKLKSSPSAEISGDLENTREAFLELDRRLSIGSRAPYGELAGQLRMFMAPESGQKINYATLGLFTARTYFFLANELSVPPPSLG